MKNHPGFMLLLVLLIATSIMCQNPGSKGISNRIGFEFTPPEWQTAICLPDDPHKSLVDRTGDLLYHYRQGGREFGTRIGVQVTSDEQWVKQELYSSRVPIVQTYKSADGLEITEEAFAITATRPAQMEANALIRTDQGGFESNWAKPAENLLSSLRNIAVHMGGNIYYDLMVPAGSKRTIALALCEGYWGEAGQRIQILSVEGAASRTIDMIAEKGKNGTAAFWFEGVDQDGDGKIKIAVDAAQNTKDINMILNGLWVFNPGMGHDDEALLTGILNGKALSDLYQIHYGGPGRNDVVLVNVLNTGNTTRVINPQLLINSGLPCTFDLNEKKMVIRGLETVGVSLSISDIKEGDNGLYTLQLESISIPAGERATFYVQYSNGSPQRGVSPETDPTNLKQVLDCRQKAITFWEDNPVLPFDRVQIPDPGIQALMESSIRNIWQAKEIKEGLPVFQVGPTCYRGLWIVDGAFLLESAAMLGAGEEARNGVAYELTLQKPDGRIESLTADYWKENGIVLWTCVRHAQLTQDKAWLESIWPKLERIAEYIKILRERTLHNDSKLDDGLNPAGTLDGGIGGTHDEYTNTYWNLTGLKAFIQAAEWLGKSGETKTWQKEYDDYMGAFKKAAKRDMSTDPSGNDYLPILLGPAGKEQLPQRAQWAFCNAVYPGQIFSSDDRLVAGNMAMLEATEREGMVYGTGWDATGIWNYFASFYGHAWLWQGRGDKAAQVLYAFGNHAAPTLVWREEQSLKGEKFKKVGDMPHNWASAEFIRLTLHLLALDRDNQLHLFEGLVPEWTQPGMVTRLNGIATQFGALTLELKVAGDGKSAHLTVDPLSDPSYDSVVVHLDNWSGKGEQRKILLDPKVKNEITIPIRR